MVYYHWMGRVYCRKERDNFLIEAVSVEPRKKDRQKDKGKERERERESRERERESKVEIKKACHLSEFKHTPLPW